MLLCCWLNPPHHQHHVYIYIHEYRKAHTRCFVVLYKRFPKYVVAGANACNKRVCVCVRARYLKVLRAASLNTVFQLYRYRYIIIHMKIKRYQHFLFTSHFSVRHIFCFVFVPTQAHRVQTKPCTRDDIERWIPHTCKSTQKEETIINI